MHDVGKEVERVEYRVVVDQVGGRVELGPESLPSCKARAEAIRPGSEVHGVFIQSRTVTESPWSDLTTQETGT